MAGLAGAIRTSRNTSEQLCWQSQKRMCALRLCAPLYSDITLGKISATQRQTHHGAMNVTGYSRMPVLLGSSKVKAVLARSRVPNFGPTRP